MATRKFANAKFERKHVIRKSRDEVQSVIRWYERRFWECVGWRCFNPSNAMPVGDITVRRQR